MIKAERYDCPMDAWRDEPWDKRLNDTRQRALEGYGLDKDGNPIGEEAIVEWNGELYLVLSGEATPLIPCLDPYLEEPVVFTPKMARECKVIREGRWE